MMTEAEILKVVVEVVRRRMPEGMRYKVFLFGSRAAGVAKERSDYDVGIEAEEWMGGGVIAGMEEELDGMEDLHKVEVVDFGRVTEEFRCVAKKAVKVLYER